MNDWSARDLQRAEMSVGLGPSKGKDFATSLGPELVSFDELADLLPGRAAALEMTARVNGRELLARQWRRDVLDVAADPGPRQPRRDAEAGRRDRFGHGGHGLHPGTDARGGRGMAPAGGRGGIGDRDGWGRCGIPSWLTRERMP